MVQQLTDEQRLQALEQFNPHDHLVDIKDKGGNVKQYYPAAYRLYELRLRSPEITIESEIVHMDEEKNFVVVKAWIFDGKTYAESEHRASAYKQGLLSALDKVETAAKARASRDFGISTELALDFDDASVDDPAPQPEVLAAIKTEVKELGLARNPQQWQGFKKKVIGRDLPDNKLTSVHVAKLTAAIAQHKNGQAA